MELKGIDVFVYWPSRNANALADSVAKLAGEGLSLQMIDNRGVKVWPAGRAMSETPVDTGRLLELQKRIAAAGIEIASTQMLRTFNGQPGFTLAQGQ